MTRRRDAVVLSNAKDLHLQLRSSRYRPFAVLRATGIPSAAVALLALLQACAHSQPYEQSYLRAGDNWAFRREFADADRLFNAFDYGHAIISETFLRHPDDAAARLEGPQYTFITSRLLREPPNVPLDERAIAPKYAVTLPEAIATFEWAHALHRQLYDIIADQRSSGAERERRVADALRYYRSRRDLALSDAPKSMELMEGQAYSLAFRRAAPRFNQLIWSYHWLQMGLYDALLVSDDAAERRRAVDGAVKRFFAMNASASRVPAVMPMSAAIAPRFTERYAEAAIIFDNLHALHDVVSDILASPAIPAPSKRAAVLRALSNYRDSTTAVTSRAEWSAMSRGMGLTEMGGAIPRGGPAP
jgi:hypothetical protein